MLIVVRSSVVQKKRLLSVGLGIVYDGRCRVIVVDIELVVAIFVVVVVVALVVVVYLNFVWNQVKSLISNGVDSKDEYFHLWVFVVASY